MRFAVLTKSSDQPSLLYSSSYSIFPLMTLRVTAVDCSCDLELAINGVQSVVVESRTAQNLAMSSLYANDLAGEKILYEYLICMEYISIDSESCLI